MNSLSKKNILYNFLIWSLVAVFTATQLYLKSYQSDPENASWIGQFGVQLMVWWVWGFITPVIFWLVNKFRIDRGNALKNILIHAIASVLIVGVYLGSYSLIWNLVSSGTVDPVLFKNIYIVLFLNLFHWHLFIYMAILGIVHAREFYFDAKEKGAQKYQPGKGPD